MSKDKLEPIVPTSEAIIVRTIPKEFLRRQSSWFAWHALFNCIYYLLTLITIIGPIAMLVFIQYQFSPLYILFTGLAISLAAAILTNIKPSEAARAYIRAWRVLNTGITNFKFKPEYSVEELIKAQQIGEDILQRQEDVSWY